MDILFVCLLNVCLKYQMQLLTYTIGCATSQICLVLNFRQYIFIS